MLVASSVLVVVFVGGFVFGLFLFFADFFPALFEGFPGEKSIGHAGVVLAFFEEDLIDLDAIAFAGDLKRRLDAIHGVVVGIVFDFRAAHAGIGVARVGDFAHGKMGGARDGDAEGAVVAINQFDPIGFLVIDYVQTAVAKNHAGFVNAVAKNIVDVLLGVFLKSSDVRDSGFGNSAAIEAPAFVAIVDVNDVALGEIFDAVFVGRLGKILESFKTIQFAGMAKLAEAAGAGEVMHVQVGRAAERINGLLQDLLGSGGALLWEHDFLILGSGSW